jgi:NADH:ubiquinone oxidoreductase subunit
MALKTWLVEFFTWWNGQTLGTRLWTWRKGERVGQDEAGNVYYRTKGGAKDPALGIERRWVIYNGEAEASKIPPGWHGWLHHRADRPPTDETYRPRDWQLPHKPNMTGTAEAWRPAGSTLRPGPRAATTGDYEAWKPGG